ncbi:hypothetical protein MBAV_005554 [Candidatus Magnetobacterium bavaricum]|uniref:Uncharacterized protein n=1 Tax=Candidatus Magnetobacterium bavaricum TaxID=29290 RepID=A0A0F3GK78_9BACT|nr:hypothetical protein MBAV_005554 [Candidatus Magnetobacterium bavaricum]
MPSPVPVLVTVRRNPSVLLLNVTATVLEADILTVHWFDETLSHFNQLSKSEDISPSAVKVTEVLRSYSTTPALPFQVILPVNAITDPLPVPCFRMAQR